MHPQCSHITLKRGLFYYRRRLPAPSCSEVALALGTRSFYEARSQATLLDIAFRQFYLKCPIMADADLKPILRDYLRSALADDEAHFNSVTPGLPAYARSNDGDLHPSEADKELLLYFISETREAIALRQHRMAQPELDQLAQQHEITGDAKHALGRGILQAHIQVYEKALERSFGVLGNISTEHHSPSEPQMPQQPSGPLFSEAMGQFLTYITQQGKWSGNTTIQNKASFRLFLEVVGDMPVTEYTGRDVAKLYDVLGRLPSNWSYGIHWKGKTPLEIADAATGQSVKRMSESTGKRHMSVIFTFFNDLKVRQRILEGDNPAAGFTFKGHGRAPQKRKRWPTDKLVQLFSSPVWTGSDSFQRAKPGDHIIKDHRYWLPLLGLYHGNRLEECAQLQRADIKSTDGISYLHLTDEIEVPVSASSSNPASKRLKNETSKRRVPIHPVLINLGFLEYVAQIAPAPSDSVFPQLKARGADMKRGIGFTVWFTGYRRKIGLYEELMDYHSFRHGVATKLHSSDAKKTNIIAITGHEGDGTDETVYFDRDEIPISTLYETICKVSWPEVEAILLPE